MLWYSLEAPRQGTSNEYPQHIFLWRSKKNIIFFFLLLKKVSYLKLELLSEGVFEANILKLPH